VQRSSLIILFAAAMASAAGCDLEVEIANAAPRVTWIAAQPAADGVVDLTVWVYDLDRDPVDLAVTWSLDGASQGKIVLAPGGHGTGGLTTDATDLGPDGRPDPDGQPHLVRWDLGDQVGDNASLQLTFVPDDGVAATGPSAVSPTFTAAGGLPSATELTAP